VLVLKYDGGEWAILSPISKTALRKQEEFTGHAAALYNIED